MRARLLVFDPDIAGRRLLREALADTDLELTLIQRATGKTAADALRSMTLDSVIVGLPAELSDLVPLFTELHSMDLCPPVYFLHDEPTHGMNWLTKDKEGLKQLHAVLSSEIRAYKLRRATTKLQTFSTQVKSSARSQLAMQVTDVLLELEIPAMYVSFDPVEFWWELRSSNFPSEVVSEVIAITDAQGGVATDPDKLTGFIKQLFTGAIDDHTFPATEFLKSLMPSAGKSVLRRMEQHLDISEIHVVAIRTGPELNGFLLLGYSPTLSERKALRDFGQRFGRLMSQAEEHDVLSQQARSMRALQEVMLNLSATLDPSDLLNNVLESLEMVVPFDLAGIALWEDQGLKVQAIRGVSLDFELLRQSQTKEEDLMQAVMWLVEQDAPVLLDMVDHDGLSDSVGQTGRFESWIGVPISWGPEQLGFLFLASAQSGALETIHLESSIGFARQLAIALQNARLLQASRVRAERLKLVNEIGRYAISVLDTQQLVEEVATRVCSVFKYFAVRILLVDGDKLVPYALSGIPEDLSADPEQTIAIEDAHEIALAVQRDEPFYLDFNSPRWEELIPSELGGAKAAVYIPLSVVSEVVGIMEIYARTARALGQEDIDVLEVLAAQIAISVVNARLFNEIRTHATELESRVDLRTQELQSQKERTEAILRSVADAILVLDLQGAVVLANPMGQELLDSDQGPVLHESVREMFVAEGVVQSSIEVGEVTYQALASPVEFEGEAQGTVVVLRDITQLKELDQLKSQFVATVSHELRTPLTNIKLYLSLLRSAAENKRARYHKVLIQETERLSAMIEDLLNLSRLESQRTFEKEQVALDSLLRLVADNHEPACVSKGITFLTEFSMDSSILGDRAQIIQVFTNLLSNAIAYTPTGGEISLRIAGEELIEDQRYVRVVLRDTGIGIRKEDLPHVFDRFYRGVGAQKYQAEGSGLGLAIVREILDNHDAKVAVDSQPGAGTKFTVWLPALGE